MSKRSPRTKSSRQSVSPARTLSKPAKSSPKSATPPQKSASLLQKSTTGTPKAKLSSQKAATKQTGSGKISWRARDSIDVRKLTMPAKHRPGSKTRQTASSSGRTDSRASSRLDSRSSQQHSGRVVRFVEPDAETSMYSDYFEDMEEEASLEYDFFAPFTTVPRLSNISMDSIDLYGSGEESKVTESTEGEWSLGEAAETAEEQEMEEASYRTSELSLYSTLELPPSLEDEPIAPPPKPLEDIEVFEKVFEKKKPPKKTRFRELVRKLIMRQKEDRRLANSVQYFLNDLIEDCVDRVEYEVLLPTDFTMDLDKMKLFKDLKETMDELSAEEASYEFLEGKVVEYFRRKRKLSHITPETFAEYEEEMEHFQRNVDHLDELLGKERAIHENFEKMVKQLEIDIATLKDERVQRVNDLDELFRQTIVRDSNSPLKDIVKKRLREMSRLRDQISQARGVVIRSQHTLSTLKEELRILNTIGPDLQMRDFDTLLAETSAYEEKLEKRENARFRLRTGCENNVHISAHLDETRKTFQGIVEMQNEELRKLKDEKHTLRCTIHSLMTERTRLREVLAKRSEAVGLLDKPILLKDYDEVVERIEELKKENGQKKKEYAELHEQIRYHTKVLKCKSKSK